MKKLLILAIFVLGFFSQIAADTPISLNIWDDIQFPGSSSESITGVRINLLYGVNQDVTGIDFGVFFPFNFVRGNMTGVQWGLVNIAQSLHGIQLGLVNINKSGVMIPQDMSKPLFFPFINWGF